MTSSMVFTVLTATIVTTTLTPLETLAIIFQALRLWTLASSLRLYFILPVFIVLAVVAFTVATTCSSLWKAVAVVRLTFRLSAFTFGSPLRLWLLWIDRQHIAYFTFSYLNFKVPTVKELKKSNLYWLEAWGFKWLIGSYYFWTVIRLARGILKACGGIKLLVGSNCWEGENGSKM